MLRGVIIEQYKPHFSHVHGSAQSIGGAADGDLRRLFHRISICPRRYCWKRDGPKLQLIGNADRLAMAASQRLGFAAIASTPERPHGMDYMPRSELTTAGRHRFACRQPTNSIDYLPAFVQNRRTSRAMDRAVDSASAEQRRIGRIHDRIGLFARDIAWTGNDQ